LLFHVHVHNISQVGDMTKDTKMRPKKTTAKAKSSQKTLRERRDVDIMNVRSPASSADASLQSH
jgi:hypothetical protein